ncbi:MAG TPA: hypothetical protein VIF57_23605 [Polyangia bacterium]|jgi:hypothetical protein
MLAAGMIVAGAAAAPACSRTLDAGPGLRDAGGAGFFDGGGAGASSGSSFVACAPNTQVGAMYLAVQATSTTTGYTAFDATIWDGVHAEPYQNVATSGACALLAGAPPADCTPPCAGAQICRPPGQCAPPPQTHSVGYIEIAGLANPFMLPPFDGGTITYESEPGSEPFPPAAAGALLTLTTTGGDYAPFSLTGTGVAPLFPPAGTLTVARDQPLALTWPSQGGPAQVRVSADVDLGNNTGLDMGRAPGTGIVRCEFSDSGAGTVPAELINTLLDQGVGTGPQVRLTRQTVDSTTIAPGCVEFTVASGTTQPVTIN